MKETLGIMSILVILGFIDLNPLLLWDPYCNMFNKLVSAAPGVMFGIVFLALIVAAALSAYYEPRKQTVVK